MAKYTGKTARVDVPASVIAEKFSDLSVMESHVKNIPPEQLEKIGDLSFEPNAIILKNPAIGEMVFNVVERSPEKIVFNANGMLPLEITVNLKPVEESVTDVTTVLDIDIPMMLRPLIGGKLQQVADSFGELIGKLASGKTII